MKKFFHTKVKWLHTTLFAIILLMLSVPQEAWASYENRPTSNQSFDWDFANGWLYIKINIADEEGGGSPDGGVNYDYDNTNSFIRVYSGSNTIANLYWGSTDFGGSGYKIRVVSGTVQYCSGGNWQSASTGTEISGNTSASYTSGDHSVKQLELRVTIPAQYYGSAIGVQAKGQWGRNSASDSEFDHYITERTAYTFHDVNISSASYSYSSGCKAAVGTSISSYNTTNNHDDYGQLALYDGNNTTPLATISTISSGSNTFNVPVDETFLNTHHTLKVVHEYSANTNHNKTSNEYILKAFMQVSNITANYEQADRRVKLQWNIPAASAPANAITGDNFVIQRATDAAYTTGLTNVATIAYNASQSSYEYMDNWFNNQEVEGTYYYRIRRTGAFNSWTNNCFIKICSVEVNTNHLKLTGTPTATLVSGSAPSDTIKWSVNSASALWSSGSRFVLKRINLTNSTETIVLEASDKNTVIEGQYIDELISNCNRYSYRLEIVPGSGSYTRYNPLSTNSIKPVDIGTLAQFSASKGYHPGKVSFEWKSNGYFNEFMISRRVYAATDTNWQWVRTVQGSEVSNSYQSEDEQGDPGVIYEYRIVGVVSCDNSATTSNAIIDIGFRRPVGMATGRVTYGSGTAVCDVKVMAEVLNPEDAASDFRSIAFAGDANSYMSYDDASQILNSSSDKFTFQAWVNPNMFGGTVFSANQTSLSYSGNTLSFTVDGVSATATDTIQAGIYRHITAVYNGGQSLTLYINGALAGTAAAATLPTLSGALDMGKNFNGSMDEVRIWSRALNEAEINNNYRCYLVGNENGIKAYWRFEEAIPTKVYDMSSVGNNTFNKRDITLHNATIGAVIPTSQQLSVMGLTDTNGNYVINAIPYSGTGTNYKFTPMFGVHSFNPSTQLRMIGQNTPIQDNINFEDVSSFPVHVSVYYSGTHKTFGVEGVSFTVDGMSCMRDGQIITTGINGEATIDVPIGYHNVKAVKSNHTFELKGYFPYDPVDSTKKFDFQQPRNIEFFDNTTVKMVGRVVGGPVEAEYPLGFGLSTNNIGYARITLKPDNIAAEFDYRIDTVTNETTQNNPAKATATLVTYGDQSGYGQYITIDADTATGEFIACLLPEKYTIQSVKYGIGTGANEQTMQLNSQTLNLSSGIMWQDELLTEERDTIINFTDTTTYTATLDTFRYEYKQSFIYRSTPTLSVYNERGQRNLFYGDTVTVYENVMANISDTIPLKTPQGGYTFGYPAFAQMGNYGFVLTAYEPYTNVNNSRNFEVPVTDGRVRIANELDRYAASEPRYIDLDSNGRAYYQFVTADPNFTLAANRDQSFLKNCSFTLSSGGSQVSKTFSGFILGGLPTGNNFITLGPKTVDFIIRDPYGSESSAFVSENVSVEKSYEWSNGVTFGAGVEGTLKFGADVKVFAGVGAGTITETDYNHNVVAGVENSNEYVSSNSTKNTVSTTTTISTSDSPDYIGANGDVFVGSAVNIVYGKCNTLGIVKNDATNQDTVRLITGVTINSRQYTLGHSESMFFSPSFATKYSYTQYHIVEELIPSLIEVRNSFLRTDITDVDNFVNTTNNPIYLSRLLGDHDAFGANNNDEEAFGISVANADLHDGVSYRMVLPEDYINFPELFVDMIFTDSIRFYNQQIRDWYSVLAINEKEKLTATVSENRSFDAGTTVESEITTCSGSSSSETWDVDVHITGSLEMGFDVAGVGLGFKVSANVGYKYHQEESTSTENCTTWSYTLADHDGENYYSMDILEPVIPGHGPMFRTRGGQSSCPYEGEERTQFYEPEEHTLSYATMRISKPVIGMDAGYSPVIANVPGNLPAIFHVVLTNESETGSSDWFELVVDETSNPNGAIIEMDGYELNANRVFRLMPNVANQKLITVRRGPDDAINDYTNLRILLRSQCFTDDVDTLIIDAHFLPYCSNVTIVEPEENGIVNLFSTAVLPVKFSDFDLNNVNFSHLALQYNDGSGWVTVQQFYVDSARLNAALLSDPTGQVIPSIPFTYNFDMTSKPDGSFKLRAASLCYDDGTVNTTLRATGYSAEINMVKDMLAPVVFGSIQPADGILDIGDDIMITFNEPINGGMLTAANFTIEGILNGYDLNHNAGVSFNGINESVDITQEMNLTGKSFTVEMWLQIPQDAENRQVTLFNHGNEAQSFSFGFTPENKLFVKIDDQTITSNSLSNSTLFATNEWAHLAVAVTTNEDEVTVTAYLNDNTGNNEIIFAPHSFPIYEGCGVIKVGAKLDDQEAYQGNMHELRIWTKPLSVSTVYEKMSKSLSGNENGLMGYWQMDEARGTVAYDKARSRQALMNAQWFVLPLGKAVAFNGSTQMVEANFVTPIGLEQDYAITFWFKGTTPQVNGCLFSLGNGMDDYSPAAANERRDKLSIFVENGQLYVQNNQHKTLLSDVNPFDAHWHHLAFSVRRNANATLYLDGIKIKDVEASIFGGLTGDQFVLGARKWNTSPVTYTTDMYFDGQMDEFRMWQYALTNQIIELDMTAKLRGNEMGLAAYYPFEKYENIQGDVQLIPTLDDQWSNPIAGAPNGGTAIYVNGSNLSDDAAKIKDARPLRTVNYTPIVNNDKINIVVDEPMALIESCVIEFTMQGIRDMHNNVMKSPKKWTAYINQNYLKWSEEHITIRKQQFEPYTFKVNAVNKSGVQQTFSIENLPAWLTASPTSGTIAPIQSQEIVFTVSEGLNVGIYDENIYLRGESGIDELLAIDLRVLGEQPDWNVDPNLYNYSMNITGELNINGIFSTDVEDRLAAFNGQTCIGVCTLRYVQQFDKYLAFLTIYGNTSGTPLSFKIWDASTGTTYASVMPDTLTFQENSYYGTVVNPVIFKTVNNIEQVIALKAGWNWISKNVTRPDMTSTNEVFRNNQFNEGDFLKSQFNNHDEYYNGNWSGAISNSGGLTNTQAYMLQVATPKSVLLYGEAVNTNDNKITLYSGWSWIGYTPQINLSVNEAFVGAQPKDGDLVKNQNSFAVYYDGLGEWMGTLNYLTPGAGYLYCSKDITKQHSYPNISSLGNSKSMLLEDHKSIEKSDLVHRINRNQYPNNFSLIAVVEAENINLDNGKILAYAAGECRGIGLPVEVVASGDNRYFITVSGNNQNELITFRFESESGEIYSLHEVVTYKDNQLIGSVTQPFIFTIGAPAESKLAAYPVPFTQHLTISYLITENDFGEVRFDIADVNGKVLSTFEVNHSYTGTYTHSIDEKVAHLTRGIYFITMTNKNSKQVIKVVKL